MVWVNTTQIRDVCILTMLYPRTYQLTLGMDMVLIRNEYPEFIYTLSSYKTVPTPGGLNQLKQFCLDTL